MRGRSWAVAMIAALCAACQPAPNLGASCARDSECVSPLVCRFGSCRTECAQNRDCPAGARCLLAGGLGSCSLDRDERCESGGHSCASGLTCLGDRCVNTCTTMAQCPADAICQPAVGTGVSFCFAVGREDAGAPDDASVDAPDTGVRDAASPTDGSACGAGGCGAATAVCVGDSFACAVREADGHVLCWGSNSEGQLGDGTDTLTARAHRGCASGVDCSSRPVEVLAAADGMPIVAHQVACASATACAAIDTSVVCWGSNVNGEVGLPTNDTLYGRAAVVPLTGIGPIRTIEGMRSAVCVQSDRTSGEQTWCWGLDNDDVMGLGSSASDNVVGPTRTPEWDAQDLALGHGHICGLDARGSGATLCDGNHREGELGSAYLITPPSGRATIAFGASHATALAAGAHFTAALVDGDVWTWGSNAVESLGRAATGSCPAGPCDPDPVALGLPETITAVWAQGFDDMVCAQSAAHTWCWGGTDRDGCLFASGACGTPAPIGVLDGATWIAPGARSLCAVDGSGEVICFGENGSGQLGDGTDTSSVRLSDHATHVCIASGCP